MGGDDGLLSSISGHFDEYPVEDMEPNYGDEPREMTFGRRLARHLSSKHSWYFPHRRERSKFEAEHPESGGAEAAQFREEEEGRREEAKPPSLDAAWAYFEHITLPRHFMHHHDVDVDEVIEGARGGDGSRQERRHRASVFQRSAAFREHTSLWSRTFGRRVRRRKHAGVDLMERAEPGECAEKTSLYSVLHTPESQLADFGEGVGLYFNSLRSLGFIALVAGLLNVPVILYFRSEEYAADGQSGISKGILAGSAICTDTKWRACPNCTREQWDPFPATYDRYATANAADGETLHFILGNVCDVSSSVGLFSFLSLLWVTLSVYVMGKYAIRKEVAFDEAQQTASDYSVEVENPPKDAHDPEEWRDFFSQFGGHVTVCTVALDNEDLIRVLRNRRRLLLQFWMGLPPGAELDTDNLEGHLDGMPAKPWWKKLLCLPHYAELCGKIRALESKIEEMSSKRYEVSNVFLTFETEEAQRTALDALSVRKWDVWNQNAGALPGEFLFRGQHVLSVREPPEPSAVRWQDLDETFRHQLVTRVVTTIVSLGLIVGGVVIIGLSRRVSAATAALVIMVLNQVTPPAINFLTNLESHSSEGSKQTSRYIKMTALRWCYTAIATTITNPFTDTAQDGNGHLINGVYAIYIASVIKTPLLQIGDIMGNLNRHYFGPRAPDQRRMNLKFAGTAWQLSERYTDLTKVLFFCVFYSVVFPAGFFFTALTLFVHYWTDKFCLLRLWAPAPRIGTEISKFSRNYFFALTILVYAIMLAYWYASFPFDNACDEGTPVSQSYVGTYNATIYSQWGDPLEVTVSISPDDTNRFFCSQDLIRYSPPAFPPVPAYQPEGAEWMTPGQETWSRVIGWTSVAVLCVVSVLFVNRTVLAALKKILFKPYEPSGKAMADRFSEVEEIYGYVPQVKIAGYPFPKLLCYIDGIDRGLVGWTDPHHPYDHHNLIFDVPKVARAVEERRSRKSPSRADDKIVTDSLLFSIVKNWPPESAEGEPAREGDEEVS